jgi:hypothetical protein
VEQCSSRREADRTLYDKEFDATYKAITCRPISEVKRNSFYDYFLLCGTAPCSLVDRYQSFEVSGCFDFQGAMEINVAGSSEMLVSLSQIGRRHISEYHNFNIQPR